MADRDSRTQTHQTPTWAEQLLRDQRRLLRLSHKLGSVVKTTQVDTLEGAVVNALRDWPEVVCQLVVEYLSCVYDCLVLGALLLL